MLSFDSANSPALDILENMDVGVLVYDAQGAPLFANALALQLLGVSLEALQAAPRMLPLVDKHGAPLAPEDLPLNRVLATGEAVTRRIFGLATAPGEERCWLSMSARPVRDTQGEMRRIVVTLVDTTERKRAEDRSETARKQLESALASMTDAVFITSADGRVLQVNEGFIRFYRFKERSQLPAQLEDFKAFMQLLYPDGSPVPVHLWALPRALRGEVATNSEFTLRRLDTGEEWPVSYSFAPIRSDAGEILGAVLVARDISAFKQREAALQAAEGRSSIIRRTLESAFASMTDALYILDAEGNVVDFNDAFVSFFRFPSREACPLSAAGYAILEMYDAAGNEVPAAQRVAAAVLRGEVATNREIRLRRRDTGEEWVASYGYSPIRSVDDGAITGAVVVARDITESKRKEEALRVAEAESRAIRQRLESALANMTDALVVTDAEGNFLEFNDAFVRYLRAPSREACLRHLREYPAHFDVFFPSGAVAPVQDWSLSRALRGETATNAEYILRRRATGESWTGSYNYAPIRGADGRIEGAVVVARDVTAQREAEQSLKESESRFRALINSAPEGVLVHRNGIVMFANPAMLELLGTRSVADMVGSSIFNFIAEEHRQLIQVRINEQIETGNPVPAMELDCLRTDGSRAAVEASAVPVDFDGERAHLVFVRDVSTRKLAAAEKAALEQQMRQMQKLDSIGRLAGGVAHDFNNIVMVQKGYCELLRQQLRTNDPLRRPLREIEACADRAAGLTRQLLAFSRKQVIEPVVFDVNAVMDSLVTMLRRLIGEDIDLAVALSPQPALIRADPGQIEQVLVNLAVNARDAMRGGGRLTVTIEAMAEPSEEARGYLDAPKGPCVRISVSDTGHGMDEDTRSQIFEPFFTTKPVGTGTGLGLSTVHGIVHQSGGTIAVHSEPGAGTTFTLYLPQVSGEVAPEAQKSTLGGAGAGECIMLVEDDPALRTLMQLMLEGLGYTVQAAPSAEVALGLFAQAAPRPALLLTDVVMPGMNGRALAERLRELSPGLPVIFMSGYTHDIIVHHGVAEEGLEFIQKPFTMAAISEKLKKVLAH